MIPIQFYLAGHGAMEGADAADKGIIPMKSGWDPHVAFGTLMLLVALLILLQRSPPVLLADCSDGAGLLSSWSSSSSCPTSTTPRRPGGSPHFMASTP